MIPQDDLYDRTRRSWEAIWEQESSIRDEIEVLNEARTSDQFDVFPQYLSKEGYILEAGSGLGAAMLYLRDRGYKMIGCDYAEQALRQFHAYDASIPVVTADVHALPYATNSLHGYLSFGVFEHFAQGMSAALREAHRVLTPGGIMVLTIPYPNVINRLVRWRRKLAGQNVLNNADFYESTYTQRDLERELTEAGFEVLLAKPTSHSFTFWGLGGVFRAKGYYRTSTLAEFCGALARETLPWAFNYTTMMIARKRG
jgi:SAM-dependent methyltransferase